MELHLYCTETQVFQGLVQYYPHVQWKLIEQAKQVASWQNDDSKIVVIKSPIQFGEILIAPEQAWQKYLSIHQPKTKLIIATFSEVLHLNYLDMLNLPNDLLKFVDQAPPISSMPALIPAEAMDITDKLKFFFSGHGKESIMDTLTKIQLPLKMAIDSINIQHKDFQTCFEVFLSELPHYWQIFKNRWQRYLFLFKCLPFFELFEKSSKLIAYLDKNFDPSFFTFWSISELESTYKSLFQLGILLNQAKQYE